MKKIKILTVFGTRPEVIKLAPFLKAVAEDPDCINIACATTQHKKLQNDALKLFNININYDLDIMSQNQDLFHITESIMHKIKPIFEAEHPDVTVVQGDTTTAFTAALSSFYFKIPVVHIEAGLRTGDLYHPYPEELNRNLIAKIATLHMATTRLAVLNLAKEGITNNVFNVGNTLIDAMQMVELNRANSTYNPINNFAQSNLKKVLITVHRRENFGSPLKEFCEAIKELADQYSDHLFIWPVHPNPNIQQSVHANLSGIPNLKLIEPISYFELINLLKTCNVILSDSGGIQEEAGILGKKIIILRKETERQEIVQSGLGVLCGTDREKILLSFKNFVNSSNNSSQVIKEIYGKPGASQRILQAIKNYLT